MENDVKDFLVRIVNTISMGLLWLLINMTIGIYYNLAFYNHQPSLLNYIFYCWFIGSLIVLIFYFIKKWRKHL